MVRKLKALDKPINSAPRNLRPRILFVAKLVVEYSQSDIQGINSLRPSYAYMHE